MQRLVPDLLLGPTPLDDRSRDVGDRDQEVDVGLAEGPADLGLNADEHAVRAGVALDRDADAGQRAVLEQRRRGEETGAAVEVADR